MRKIFLATLLVFMMSAATALAANWQQIYTDNDDNVLYFDADSVQINSITETARNSAWTTATKAATL